MREIHSQSQHQNVRKSSVSTIVSEFDRDKRKAEVISPPTAQPVSKKDHVDNGSSPTLGPQISA